MRVLIASGVTTRATGALVMGALLIAAVSPALAVSAPFKLAPADDAKPAPVGAAARAKHGPEPLAKPPVDVGSAEDPTPSPEAAYPTLPPAPAAKADTPPK